jgi:threonyl-tRNA synthetase
MLIVEVKKKKKWHIYIRRHGQEGKGNITVTIEEFAAIVEEESKNIKSIYSLT